MSSAASVLKKFLACVSIIVLANALVVAGDTASPPSRTQASSKSTAKSHNSKSGSTRKKKRSRVASWRRGQQKVDPQRAREIQEALIREHYLKGTPSGRWDDATQSAMQRYQAANGWQSKTVPDSRALIKLGLGPSHDHLLNPESAMTSSPQPRNSGAPDSSITPHPQK